MTVHVPFFPTPQRELDIDLSTEAFAKATENVSTDIEISLARASSLIDSKRTRAAAAELERLSEVAEASASELKAPMTGLRAGLRLTHGDAIESERLILSALVATNRVNDPDPIVQASLLNNLGVIAHRYHDKPATAEERFGQAIDILSRDTSKHVPRLSRYHRNLGLARDSLGDFDGAASAYRDALASTGDDPVLGLNIVENLALNREMVGQSDEAESYIEAAFLNLRSWRAEYPRLFIRACDDLSLRLLKGGDFNQLRGVTEQQAVACLTLLPGEEHWRAVQPLTFMALAQWFSNALHDAGGTLRYIASLRRQTDVQTPDPVAIIGGTLELYPTPQLNRRAHAMRLFQGFATKLLF